ncbi:MAG: ribonucleotide-diphosphate reductase subunit alpha, partial [Pseudomonadota bacterium]
MSAKEAIVEQGSTAVRRGKPKPVALDLVARRAVRPSDIEIDVSRDALLTEFGKQTLQDRYLLKDETFQGMFARVSA